eukprot:6532892-Pyramimonas_sp.AAC.1
MLGALLTHQHGRRSLVQVWIQARCIGHPRAYTALLAPLDLVLHGGFGAANRKREPLEVAEDRA